MNQYPLTESEQQQYDEICARISQYGDLYRCNLRGHLVTDHTGSPEKIDYEILDSRRYLVDAEGVLWRFFPEGSSKDPTRPHGGGAPWRNNRVEMFNGHWRKVNQPDGTYLWKKTLVAAPLDKRVNGHPGMGQIQWYKSVKGYSHPLAGPDQPDFGNTNSNASKWSSDNDSNSPDGGKNDSRAHSVAPQDGTSNGEPAGKGKKTSRKVSTKS